MNAIAAFCTTGIIPIGKDHMHLYSTIHCNKQLFTLFPCFSGSLDVIASLNPRRRRERGSEPGEGGEGGEGLDMSQKHNYASITLIVNIILFQFFTVMTVLWYIEK
jgi:hypothetical protein